MSEITKSIKEKEKYSHRTTKRERKREKEIQMILKDRKRVK